MSVLIGVCATKAPWSAALRTYVRDHASGMQLEVLMGPNDLARLVERLDVLVLDDVMRTFSAADVARASACGVVVLGVCDDTVGLGPQHMRQLGAEHIFPGSCSPAELVAFIGQLPPRATNRRRPGVRPLWPVGTSSQKAERKGVLTAWTKVSGGAGLSEAVVAAADELSKHGRTVLIEAEEISPVLVSRLLRDNGAGLPWALGRAGQGLAAFPEALSGARHDGARCIGNFDAVCASPMSVQPVAALQMEKLLTQALIEYEYIIVETGWLVGAALGRDRFSSVRSTLATADSIVVFAQSDPEGAARLVQWRAMADSAGVRAPCFAVFGRASRGRYERSHLKAVVDHNTADHPFEGIAFLPEDTRVARARWNAELVGRGAWSSSLRSLVDKAVPRQCADVRSRRGGHSARTSGIVPVSTANKRADLA
ncbi:MAG TPA: hypothetical protein VFN61_07125 [Acidimicrobiales bacterium]|nr:hypothetical protein [Acidimicrobiales bacterium]